MKGLGQNSRKGAYIGVVGILIKGLLGFVKTPYTGIHRCSRDPHKGAARLCMRRFGHSSCGCWAKLRAIVRSRSNRHASHSLRIK